MTSRRSFLGALAALIAAPKALLSLERKPAITGRSGVEPVQTIAWSHPQDPMTWAVCEEFAKKYQLELERSAIALAVFTLRGPMPGVFGRWSSGLDPVGRFRLEQDHRGVVHPVRITSPAGDLKRQLQFQLAKVIRRIELEHGWQGTPPGISIVRRSGAVGVWTDGYFPEPIGPVYRESDRWLWERTREPWIHWTWGSGLASIPE